jgi:hypothetical protein
MCGNVKKGWMTSFLFKEFLGFFKKFLPCGIFLNKSRFSNPRWAWITCNFRSNKVNTCIWINYGHILKPYFTCTITLRCDLFQALARTKRRELVGEGKKIKRESLWAYRRKNLVGNKENESRKKGKSVIAKKEKDCWKGTKTYAKEI